MNVRMPKSRQLPKFGQLPYYLLIFFAILLAGIGAVVYAGFSASNLTKPWFINKMAYMISANVLITLGALQRKMFILTNTRQDYKDLKQIQYEFAIDKSVINFPKFLNIYYNLPSKVTAWKTKVTQKLLKATNKNKPQKVIDKLKLQLTDEWINDNINYIAIKYFFIAPTTVTNNYTPKSQSSPVISDGSYLLMNLSPKFLISIGMSIFFASFTIGVKELNWETLIQIATNLVILIWNYITGSEFAVKYFEEHIMGNLNYYISIINHYFTTQKEGDLAWQLDEKKICSHPSKNIQVQPQPQQEQESQSQLPVPIPTL